MITQLQLAPRSVASRRTRHVGGRRRCGVVAIWGLGLGLALAGLAMPLQASTEPAVGGRLSWVAEDGLDLLGELWAEAPLGGRKSKPWFISSWSRTNIEDTTSDFDFKVRELDYALETGWRSQQGWGGLRWSLFAGQAGKEAVDRDGRSYVRYAAIGVESQSASRDWLSWALALGPVVDDRALDADGWFRGSLELRTRFQARSGPRFAFELRGEGLLLDDALEADWSAGPAIIFPPTGERAARLFVRYQRSRSPLGTGLDTWLAGLEYSQGGGGGRGAIVIPEIHGGVWSGGGLEDRSSATMQLAFRSPPFADEVQLAFNVQANLLTGREADQLFYRYTVGLERDRGKTTRGIYLFHRSNHLLAEPLTSFTGLNVVEVGFHTPGWHAPVRERRRFDLRLRVGYLVNSSFGEDERLFVRYGIRTALRRGSRGLQPYVWLDREDGEVVSQTFGLGLEFIRHGDLRFEYREDDQYLGPDRTALLGQIGYQF